MSKIHELDQDLINKIAAGEVIERPASVVKELLENAIDAKAKNIIIEVKEGGKSYIRITDDGQGMSREDLVKSIKKHKKAIMITAIISQLLYIPIKPNVNTNKPKLGIE